MSKFSSSSCSEYSPRTKNHNERINVAKAILQECSSYSGDSLFNHLSNIIKRVLDENPPNVVDYFEEYSRNVREDKLYSPEDHLIDMYLEPKLLQPAKRFIDSIAGHEMPYYMPNETLIHSKKNILELLNLWATSGIRFSSRESFLLAMAVQKYNTNNTRFWGKILGLQKDYYIIETDPEEISLSVQVKTLKERFILFQKTYYVCNDLLEEWNQLPNVTHEQLNFTREFKKYFTGDLETDIPSFPGNGKEKHYLRATIEHITAATYVAPQGYYLIRQLNQYEEKNIEIGKESVGIIEENPKFEPAFLSFSTDPGYWVHCRPNFDNSNTDNHELFISCTNDISPEASIPWSLRLSTKYIQLNPIVIMKSNIWPGANAITVNYTVDNMYIGYGHKYISHRYSEPDAKPKQIVYVVGFDETKEPVLPLSIYKSIQKDEEHDVSTTATESAENIVTMNIVDEDNSTSAIESDESMATYKEKQISVNDKVYDSTSVDDISEISRTGFEIAKIKIENSSTSECRSISNEINIPTTKMNIKANDSRSITTNLADERSEMDLNILRTSDKKKSESYSTSEEISHISRSIEIRNIRHARTSTFGGRNNNIEFISNLAHIDEDSNDNRSTSATESDENMEQNESIFISANEYEYKKIMCGSTEYAISEQINLETPKLENDKSSTSAFKSESNE